MIQNLTIRIFGRPGVGKSSAASLILHALRSKNLNVDLSDRVSRDISDRDEEQLDAAIEGMRNSRILIEIDEVEIC